MTIPEITATAELLKTYARAIFELTDAEAAATQRLARHILEQNGLPDNPKPPTTKPPEIT